MDRERCITITAGYIDMRVRFAILERISGGDGGRGISAGGVWGSVSRARWRRYIELCNVCCSDAAQDASFAS